MKKIFLCAFFYFSFFGLARADFSVIYVSILPNGDVPAVTIACATGHNYTLSLIHENGGTIWLTPGTVDRKYCEEGTVSFDSFNLNSILKLRLDPLWWNYVSPPLEYIVKDTTSLSGCDSADSCEPNSLGNGAGAPNNSVYLASSTFYPTAAAGPIFDTLDHATWFNTDNIFLDISTTTRTATLRANISQDDVGASLNFNISDSNGVSVYAATPIFATTTGDLSYSWNFPPLTDSKTTKPSDFVFHADIIDANGAKRLTEKTATVFSPVDGYPGYANFSGETREGESSWYSPMIQTLGTGLSGTLTQIDVETNNQNVGYYGSRPLVVLYQCDDDTYGSPAMSGYGAGCVQIFSGTADNGSQLTPSVNSIYVDPPIVLDPSKYYFLEVQGDNEIFAFSAYYGSVSDTVDGGCFKYDSSKSAYLPCINVADLYFYLRGVTKAAAPPPACKTDCFSNVLFLPGIEASRLYKPAVFGSNENRLWEPDNDTDVTNLFLDQNGKSVITDIYTRDVMDDAYGIIGIYGSFLDTLKDLKSSGKIADYSAAAYDWRLSLDDILNGGTVTGSGDSEQISYIDATTSPYIISELRRLVASSKSGKVTIVAHSNGGLVAKALLKRLADTNDPLLSKIDRLIFVAVPQLGTPEAIAADLHGYEQDIMLGKLSAHEARQFAQNSSPAYNLLPDENYFTYVDTPVVTFDPALSDWISKYGPVIHSQELLNNFLTDTYGRVAAESTDIKTPVTLNAGLLSAADTLHDSLDTWQIPSGIKVTEIAGWGVPTTVSGINYVKENGTIEPDMNTTIDGDGTVTTPSALWTNGDASVDRYWVDLKKYNNDYWYKNYIDLLPFDHKSILEVNKLDDFISDIITSNVQSLSSYNYLSTESPPSTEKRLAYSLHSPLTLDFYDDSGNHTGISTSTGQVEEQIPGTYFAEMGDSKYIFTDTDIPIHIFMNGYADGTFTFNVDEFQGDTEIASTTFQDIPTTASTKVSLGATGDITTLTAMSIDADGDGETDITLVPKLGQIVTYTPRVSDGAGAGVGSGGNSSGSEADGGVASGGVFLPTQSVGNGPPVGLINAPVISATTSPIFTATSTLEVSNSASTSEPTIELYSQTETTTPSTTPTFSPAPPKSADISTASSTDISGSQMQANVAPFASSSTQTGGVKFPIKLLIWIVTVLILLAIIYMSMKNKNLIKKI